VRRAGLRADLRDDVIAIDNARTTGVSDDLQGGSLLWRLPGRPVVSVSS
jgi:hypothetical protein